MKTVINIKTDPQTKEKAQEIAKKLGLPLSVILNAYLNQLVRTEEISFGLDSKMTPKLEDLLASIEEDIINKKNLSSAITSKQDLANHLASL